MSKNCVFRVFCQCENRRAPRAIDAVKDEPPALVGPVSLDHFVLKASRATVPPSDYGA